MLDLKKKFSLICNPIPTYKLCDDIGIDAEKVEPFEAENDRQHDGQHLERLFRLVGLGFFAAFGDARAALCRAKEFHSDDAPIAISKVTPF